MLCNVSNTLHDSGMPLSFQAKLELCCMLHQKGTRSLNKAERYYTTTERELLATVFAASKRSGNSTKGKIIMGGETQCIDRVGELRACG